MTTNIFTTILIINYRSHKKNTKRKGSKIEIILCFNFHIKLGKCYFCISFRNTFVCKHFFVSASDVYVVILFNFYHHCVITKDISLSCYRKKNTLNFYFSVYFKRRFSARFVSRLRKHFLY